MLRGFFILRMGRPRSLSPTCSVVRSWEFLFPGLNKILTWYFSLLAVSSFAQNN